MGESYVSISDLAWDAASSPAFEKLKTGYVGESRPGVKYEIVSGVPATAKLKQVIYVYEDASLPEAKNVFSQPPTTVYAKYWEEKCTPG